MEQVKCPGQDTRFWKPGDIFTTECPKCGAEIEFFKDDTRRRCAWCGHLFYNPKIDLGCAEWCQYAEKCVPELVQEKKATQTFKERLADLAKSRLGEGEAWNFTESALPYALELLKAEGGDPKVVLAATLLHRLDLPQAQELLQKLETEPEIIEAVTELLRGAAQEKDLNRQLYEDALTLSGEADGNHLHTRTAQRLAAARG